MDPYTLHLEWPVVDVLAYALLRTVDDLEARAIVAEHHDPDVGPASACEYRTDIRRLRQILDQIAPGTREPDPAQAAVRWIDGVYTVTDGQPVPMDTQTDRTHTLRGWAVSSDEVIPCSPANQRC